MMGILSRLFGGSTSSDKSSRAENFAQIEMTPESKQKADQLIVQGQELEDRYDFALAELRYRKAIAVAPSYPRAYINLGNVLQKLGRLYDSASAHRAALKFDTDYFGAHYNLGAVMIELGETKQAKQHLEHALVLKPDAVDVLLLLASAFEAEKDLSSARLQLERAYEIDPHHLGVVANLSILLYEMGKADAAEKLLSDVLSGNPDFTPALIGLANIQVQRGRADLAEVSYRHALHIDPRNIALWSSFLFSMTLRDDLDAEDVAREHFAFGKIFENYVAADTTSPKKPAPQRIRVGYVSADLKKHPVALFLRPTLFCHDRTKFEIFCYSNSRLEDEITTELRKNCDHWQVIADRNDQWVEELIRKDGIDVLVDLSGHTTNNRLGVFARKPAAVQAAWLGYLNTTGLNAIDFRICDRHTDPEGNTEQFNTESLARLPNSQWCYSPYYNIPLKELVVSDGRPVIFGSFNHFSKISNASLALWANILREVTNSQLRVYGVPEGNATIDDFYERVEQQGIDRDRVTLYGRLSILDYFSAIEDADIALDSIPYNGATTTLDTLWMGVPVVGLHGNRAISCGTYSILNAAGLTELIAENQADYIEKNIQLARDVAARNTLRRSLRTRLASSPVMDTKTFTRDLEDLYCRMLET